MCSISSCSIIFSFFSCFLRMYFSMFLFWCFWFSLESHIMHGCIGMQPYHQPFARRDKEHIC